MRIIKKLAEQINDEVDGAIDYAMEALDCKVEDPELSRFYFELAKTEYGHMEKLHDQVLRKIKEAREKNTDPPQWMLNKWDKQHKAAMEKAAKAKTLIEMYK